MEAGGQRHRSLCMTFCTLGQFNVYVHWWTRNGNAPGYCGDTVLLYSFNNHSSITVEGWSSGTQLNTTYTGRQTGRFVNKKSRNVIDNEIVTEDVC